MTYSVNQLLMKLSDQSRTASFLSYPFSSPVSGMTLAEAGFHYDGYDDAVVCRQCGLKYSGWKKEDDPREIHLDKSPKCPFFQAQEPEASVDMGETGVGDENSVNLRMPGACGGSSSGPVDVGVEDREHSKTENKESESITSVSSEDTTREDVSRTNLSVIVEHGESIANFPNEQGIDINDDPRQTEQHTEVCLDEDGSIVSYFMDIWSRVQCMRRLYGSVLCVGPIFGARSKLSYHEKKMGKGD